MSDQDPDPDLDGRLRAWGERERDAYGTAAVPIERLARPTRRTGWAVGGTVAVVAAVGVAVGIASLGHSSRSVGKSAGTPSASTSPSPFGRYADLILRNGDSVHATGFVVALPGRSVRFCAPSPVALDGGGSTATMTKQECGFSVPAKGIDLATLAMRQQRDGVVTGTATLDGVWHNGTLIVSTTTAPPSSNGLAPMPSTPCAAPAGGWPQGPSNQNLDLAPAARYGRAHPGAIIQFALLRPSASQVIAYILTAADPGPVRTALTARFHGRLCVVKSRYTLDQIHAAVRIVHAAQAVPANQIYVTGRGLSASAQVQIQVGLTRITPAIARMAAATPAGLIQFNAFLVPSRR
jgi:hypothetical protein